MDRDCKFNRSYAVDSFETDDTQESHGHEAIDDSKESQENENQNPGADDDSTIIPEYNESESPKEHDPEVPDADAAAAAAREETMDRLFDEFTAEIEGNGSALASESSLPNFIEPGDPTGFGQGDAAAGIPDIVESASNSNDSD